jgi:hypothetical protein
VLLGDLLCAARALLARPEARRGRLLRRLLAEARAADAWRRVHGRPHPRWGDGSLQAAAVRHGLAPEPGLDDPAYRACLVRVLAAIGAPGARL